jgi:hypothetical protein
VTLESVVEWIVPRSVIARTEGALRTAGDEGFERFVLWSGNQAENKFYVCTTHVPEQVSLKTEDGLLVRVEGAALHHLNAWLYETHETLAVQIHAHPRRAYHSQTDNSYPIVTTVGGLSVVAADFCRDGLLNRRTRTYRLTRSGWSAISRSPDQLFILA